jgi:hypothetical protein
MASNGIHSLRDHRFLEAYNQRRKEVCDKLEKNASASKARVAKMIRGVKKLRDKYGHESKHLFTNFSKEECSTCLQYKKQSNKDPGMPKELQERRLRCVEWMDHPSPTASPTASDDEAEDGLPDNATVEEAEVEFEFDTMDCVDELIEFTTQAGGGGDGTIQMKIKHTVK